MQLGEHAATGNTSMPNTSSDTEGLLLVRLAGPGRCQETEL
jgi:hypothetical protein